ncbi:MAG: BON domain-containing protein [Opitutus sp.]|nr:BON domain-containing protein [Opitutus sp.]
MKNSLKSFPVLALLGAMIISLLGACAGGPNRQSTGEYVDDAAITAKVKTELIRDEVVKAREVNVETFKGVVQLSGFVDTEEQRTRAAQIAAGVNGVTEVKNNITLK